VCLHVHARLDFFLYITPPLYTPISSCTTNDDGDITVRQALQQYEEEQELARRQGYARNPLVRDQATLVIDKAGRWLGSLWLGFLGWVRLDSVDWLVDARVMRINHTRAAP
jgi:hypothetical protein